MKSSPFTSSSFFVVELVEITTPSLLHSRLGTGDPRAAHCSLTLPSTFVTLTTVDGAEVITGGTLKTDLKRKAWVDLEFLKQSYN